MSHFITCKSAVNLTCKVLMSLAFLQDLVKEHSINDSRGRGVACLAGVRTLGSVPSTANK
jgi:hypothetical protein